MPGFVFNYAGAGQDVPTSHKATWDRQGFVINYQTTSDDFPSSHKATPRQAPW